MRLSKFATDNLRAILFVTVLLSIIGLVCLFSFPVAILPDITFPRIEVIARTGDIPISSMESQVTRPLEESIATIPGVTLIRSRIMRGADITSIDFDWGSNMVTNLDLINAAIGQLSASLPAGTQINVSRMNPTVFPVLGLSLQSRSMSQAQLWTLAEYTLKPILGRVAGVANVEVQGGRVPEIAVLVHPSKLAAFHLSQKQVESAISSSNTIQSVGLLDRQYKMYQMMVSGMSTTPEELGRIVVAHAQGVPILLNQIATVENSVQDRTMYVTAKGHQAVLLNIIRQPSANTVTVVNDVEQAISTLKSTLPKGIEIHKFYNQAILINGAVGSVRDAVLIGATLAVIVLIVFLRDLRATVICTLMIPTTFFITFMLMRLAGLTLNLMTLGALAVGIGLVIDDAIVVVENVFRHLSNGETPKGAVLRASKEISKPIIACSITTIVVFMPLTLLSGISGAFFTALAVTLSLALIVSLILALLVSPSLCATFLRVREGQQEHTGLVDKLIPHYENSLRGCLKHKWVLPTGAVLIICCTLFFSAHLGSGFMPEMDEGSFILDYVTPPGTSLHESNRILMSIEHILKTTPGVVSFSRRTGSELGFNITEPNSGDFAVMLTTGSRKPIDQIMASVRKKILETTPGVEIDFSQALQDLIGDLAGAPSPIEIKLFSDDPSKIHSFARHIASKLSQIPGVVDVKDGIVQTTPELLVHVDQVRAGRLGLTPGDVAQQLNGAVYGDVVSQILKGQQAIDVRVRYPERYRSDLQSMEMMPIHTPAGENIPLSSIATLSDVPGSSELRRENERRLLDVTGSISGRDLGSIMKDVKAMLAKQNIPSGVNVVIGGQYKSQQQAFANLVMVLALAILLVFAVMLFQFGTFTSPSVILIVMPMSLFGVTLALWITNTPLNVSSFMGAIMLVGLIVKNGILLLDQAQKAEEDGVSLEEAVIQAGRVRLRPIIMTTLAAILGLLPLGLGLGAGAQMQQPLAIAVIGGLTFSTIFTLLYAPLIFVGFRRFQAKFRVRVFKLEPENEF